MRDREVAKAVKAVWDANVQGLGTLHESPVKGNDRPPLPYATLMVRKDPRANQQSAVGEIDYRRVTIVVYGQTADQAETEMRKIDAVFNDRVSGHKTLSLQYGDWMRTESPQEGSDTMERGEPRMGSEQQPYKGTLIYRVWVSRPKAT